MWFLSFQMPPKSRRTNHVKDWCFFSHSQSIIVQTCLTTVQAKNRCGVLSCSEQNHLSSKSKQSSLVFILCKQKYKLDFVSKKNKLDLCLHFSLSLALFDQQYKWFFLLGIQKQSMIQNHFMISYALLYGSFSQSSEGQFRRQSYFCGWETVIKP